MDNAKISILVILLLMGGVCAESFQYIKIVNQLESDDLEDIVYVYQNDDLSRRYIKEVNYTAKTVRINGDVDYDFVIPAMGQHVRKNPLNPNWGDYVFYSFLSIILILLAIALTVGVIRWAWTKRK